MGFGLVNSHASDAPDRSIIIGTQSDDRDLVAHLGQLTGQFVGHGFNSADVWREIIRG